MNAAATCATPAFRVRIGRSALTGVLLAAMAAAWTWQSLPSQETPGPVRRVVAARKPPAVLVERRLFEQLPPEWKRAALTTPLAEGVSRLDFARALAALYAFGECGRGSTDCAIDAFAARQSLEMAQVYAIDTSALVDPANIARVERSDSFGNRDVELYYRERVPANVSVIVSLYRDRVPRVFVAVIID